MNIGPSLINASSIDVKDETSPSNIACQNDTVVDPEDTEPNSNENDVQGNDKPPLIEKELLFCKFCEFQAHDLERFSKHVAKPYHIKKAADAFNIQVTRDTTPKIFNCQECLISCNGENAWNQHLKGQKHRKVLEKKGALLADQKQQKQMLVGGGPMKVNFYGNTHYKKPYEKVQRTVQQPSNIPTQALGANDFANYAAPLIGLEFVTEIQVIGQSPRYQCSLCDSKFDHNLKFPHLVGAKHRMNVLKLKRPHVLQESRGQMQKRSELTAMLLREAQKLEQEEGRQQVKTKVEKSPFNAVNAGLQVTAGRGIPTARGARGNRGGRGMVVGVNRGMPSRGNKGGSARGNRGASTRGATRGATRGRGQTWSQSGQFQTYGQGTAPYNASYNNHGQVNDYGQTSYQMQPSASYYERSPEPQQYGLSSRPSGGASLPDTPSPKGSHKPDRSGGLADALGDLTKLVQNEEDASVALHVSNALTQALLQYRMVQEEGNA